MQKNSCVIHIFHFNPELENIRDMNHIKTSEITDLLLTTSI